MNYSPGASRAITTETCFKVHSMILKLIFSYSAMTIHHIIASVAAIIKSNMCTAVHTVLSHPYYLTTGTLRHDLGMLVSKYYG